MAAEPQHGSQALAEGVQPQTTPRWHVVLLDDDEHTYDYVIEMLGTIFGHAADKAYRLACEVDATGRVIVDTTVLERAEFKQQQIHAYGADWRIERCRGSMSAVLERAD
jgi:ATP-dependent Clp protease adaptor protein ClpS